MTKDEIIRMAREAGFVVDGDSWIHAGAVLIDGRKSIDKQLKAFANLVAAHKTEVITAEAYRCGHEAGAVAEREACAKLEAEAVIEALNEALAQPPLPVQPVRPWVGLTAEEIASIPLNEYALQTAEKLLKEKNK